MKFETHIHTRNNDLCAHVEAAEIVRLYRDARYGGIVITDHYFNLFYTWFADELAGKSHDQIIDRWLLGYRNARAEGERIGMTVLLGAEVRFDGTNEDFLVYGLEEEFLKNAPLLNTLTLESFLALKPARALVYQAHPFRPNLKLAPASSLFGAEVYNGGTNPEANARARHWAEENRLAMISGSDFHDRGHLGQGGIETEGDIRDEEDFLLVLRARAYRLLEPDAAASAASPS